VNNARARTGDAIPNYQRANFQIIFTHEQTLEYLARIVELNLRRPGQIQVGPPLLIDPESAELTAFHSRIS